MNRTLRMSAAVLVGSLAACSGSSNAPPVPDPPQASDDQYTLATGQDHLLDVLANDSSGGAGSPAIVRVNGAGAVTLRVDGNRIRYRPRCCDLDSDTFTYRIANASGQVADATVRVDISKRLVLHAEAPELGGQASVHLKGSDDSDRELQLVNGLRSVSIDIDGAAIEYSLEARRSERDVLVSSIGDIASLLARAGPAAELGPGGWDAMRVSTLSTALEAMGSTQGPGASSLLDSEAWLLRAQLVRALLDDPDLAAPGGSTLTAIADAAAVATLLDRLPEDFAQRDRRALFPTGSLRAAEVGEGFWLFHAGVDLDDVAVWIELASDGVARILGPYGPRTASWSFDEDDGLRIGKDPATGDCQSGQDVLFSARLIERPGGFPCAIAPYPDWPNRLFVECAVFHLPEIAEDHAGALPLVVGAEGVGISGFTPSGCNAEFSPFALVSTLGLSATRGEVVTAWTAPISDTQRLLPAPCSDCGRWNGRGWHVDVANIGSDGTGILRESGLAFAWHWDDGDQLVLDYASGERIRVNALFDRGSAVRAAIVQSAAGQPTAHQVWLGSVIESIDLEALLRDHDIVGCCRAAHLDPIIVRSDGSVLLNDGRLTGIARFGNGGRSLTLDFPGEAAPGQIRMEVVALLGDTELLMVTWLEGRMWGSSDIVRIRPKCGDCAPT